MCTLCAQHLLEHSPLEAEFVAATQSTVSGGSVGHALYGEVHRGDAAMRYSHCLFLPRAGTVSANLSFPNLTTLAKDANASAVLKERHVTADQPQWFGNVIEYIPYELNLQSLLAILKVRSILVKLSVIIFQ